ncbi:hypothetical protein [Clostridium intestinale]|uniref:nSTAND3 domain-containing NTPase n=1 Tax=Clostridium intestinale TaxID=36845 RepID=UPI0028EB4367|nr:hypothetical protein [Clostridium intestinale]
MVNYDFHKLLEYREFERFARDIVQIRDEIFLESYKEGKDQGIDGGYFHIDNTIIFQAKRWKDYRSLYRHLEKSEKSKVQKLNPDRYILAVSISLSKMQKDQIKHIFEPYIISTEDILTEEDFNNLLEQDKYKSIENKYYKLWMTSSNVLQNIISNTFNSVLSQESAIELKEGLGKKEVFVETKIYYEALKAINKNKVIIISGEPGMGKTSTAYQIGIYFMQNKEYTNFFWVKSIDDIYSAQSTSGKKVIIFDDFWGSVFQESSYQGRDEQRLAQIIERTRAGYDCILILTTREYILKQGFEKHADFKEIIEKYKLECKLEKYSDKEKLKIFFGHLKKSRLNWQQTEALFNEHKEIIKHANYNPRVIEMFLKQVDINENKYECVEKFWCYLECPENFLSSIFNNLSKESKLLSIVLLTLTKPISYKKLKIVYYRCINQVGEIIDKKSFQECIDELEKTLIKSVYIEQEKDIAIKFQNPSIKDFLYAYLRNNIEKYFDILLEGGHYYNQLLFLLSNYYNDLSIDRRRILVSKCIDNFTDMDSVDDDFDEYLDFNEREYYEDGFSEGTELSRFYKLVISFNDNTFFEYFEFFNKFIHDFNKKLDNSLIGIIDLDIYPYVLQKCIKNGIKIDVSSIMSKCFYIFCVLGERLDIANFKEGFKEEYNEFITSYKESIQNYIEEYYIEEISYYSAVDDIDECRFLYNCIQNDSVDYKINYTDEFKAEIEYYMKDLNTEIVEMGEEIELDQTEEEIEYDNIVNIFEEELLCCKKYLKDDDLEYLIRNSSINDSIKHELVEINENEECWYISEFLEDEQSFLFLEESILRFGYIPKDITMLILHLIEVMISKTDVIQSKFMGFLVEIFPYVIYRENAFLTKEEVISTAAYNIYFGDDEVYFNKLVESGLFIKKGKWYEIVNIIFLMGINVLFFTSNNTKEKIMYYDFISEEEDFPPIIIKKNSCGESIESICLCDIGSYKFGNLEWQGKYLKLFYNLDTENFVKYYLAPLVKDYVEEIKKETSLETLSTLLKDLELIIDVNLNGENINSKSILPLTWRILQNLNITYIFDLVPFEFSKEQMKYIENNFKLIYIEKEEVYRINFNQDDNLELITVLGVDKEVNKIYNIIKEVLNVS